MNIISIYGIHPLFLIHMIISYEKEINTDVLIRLNKFYECSTYSKSLSRYISFYHNYIIKNIYDL